MSLIEEKVIVRSPILETDSQSKFLWCYSSGSLDTDGSGFRESPCNVHYSLWRDGLLYTHVIYL